MTISPRHEAASERFSPERANELRDAWLAEMWPPCRELPRHERGMERARAAAREYYESA